MIAACLIEMIWGPLLQLAGMSRFASIMACHIEGAQRSGFDSSKSPVCAEACL
uniref:RxLR effector candidate protein n=1 Tax=Hyaloperonospora arabidopsidis (strain Emoy2) TaxID=559515 RepID=M4B2N8_HYAAE